MDHTLTISEDTLLSTISHINYSYKLNRLERYTSPRLANHKMKSFFGVLHGKVLEGLLKWQQTTLHTSGRKEEY